MEFAWRAREKWVALPIREWETCWFYFLPSQKAAVDKT